MPKLRVEIIGGGMAALTAAYYLSSTPQLRSRFQITVRQMGWRLGGKCASGRDESGRVIEHGLHVWFGCYANAFKLMREVYNDWNPVDGSPAPPLANSFVGRNHSRIGLHTRNGMRWQKVHWPTLPGAPWDAQQYAGLQLWQVVSNIIALMRTVLAQDVATQNATVPVSSQLSEARLGECVRLIEASDAQAYGQEPNQAADRYLAYAQHLAKANSALAFPGDVQRTQAVRELIVPACDGIRHQALMHDRPHSGNFLSDTAQIMRAYVLGIIDDLILGAETLDTLDRLEFREWLIEHGASPIVVQRSAAVRSLYDTMFQYVNGNPAKPSYAAGTALQVVARLLATYRGSMLYLVERGTGEAVIGPLYEVLVQNDVKFSFFDKAVALETENQSGRIDRLRFQRQVNLKNANYVPVKHEGGVPYWPSEPDWDQIVEGDRLKNQGVNFESHWCSEPFVDEFTLTREADFDIAILGVSLGALKGFDRNDSMVESLIQADQSFADMVNRIELVPSQAAQAWFTKDATELGHGQTPHAAVSGPEPFDIYSDMSHIIKHESWPEEAKPKALYYLCSVYFSRLFERSPTDATVPDEAAQEVADIFADWLHFHGATVWPGAVSGNAFDASVVHQLHTNANINPTDCCPASAADTTRWRLPADQSGFSNLFLAGCWTRTGMNTTCVEGAVMSGMQAARAISREPLEVVGEDFLRNRRATDIALPNIDCVRRLAGRFSPFVHGFDQTREGAPTGDRGASTSNQRIIP